MTETSSSGETSDVTPGGDPYSPNDDRPLRSFIELMAAYGAAVAVGSREVRRRGGLPERFRAEDLALVAVATHKISRLLAKDPVTSPLRAPFTRFAGTTGPAELKEDVKGVGAQKALGELVTCPFCLGQWVATAMVFGLVLAPRPTRMVASVFSVLTAADLLQFAYAAAEKAE